LWPFGLFANVFVWYSMNVQTLPLCRTIPHLLRRQTRFQ
jgi:hypothetical protein